MKLGPEQNVNMPLKTVLSLITLVSIFTFSYFQITERLNKLETQDTLMQSDLLKKAEQTPKNLEIYMLIEHNAKIIEKHITLDKKYKGADHPFAIEPKEMKDFIYGIRKIEETLGSEKRKLSKEEFRNRLMIRRSIVAKKDITKGSVIKESDIKYARPGTGIPITKSKTVINKIAKKNIKSETIISQLMVRKK